MFFGQKFAEVVKRSRGAGSREQGEQGEVFSWGLIPEVPLRSTAEGKEAFPLLPSPIPPASLLTIPYCGAARQKNSLDRCPLTAVIMNTMRECS